MIKVTIRRANGTTSQTLIQPTQIVSIDEDLRPERDRQGANSVVTMQDGKKLWVQETVEQIANKLGA
jgi:uncharacterized protein YlzI (FlbEa/FlbD family)